jgi:hypothetical protein
LKYISDSITITLIMNPEHPTITAYLDENGFRKVMHKRRPQDAPEIMQERIAKDIIALELRSKAHDRAKTETGPNKENNIAAAEKSVGANSSAREPNPDKKTIHEIKANTANPLQILHKFGLEVKNLKIF